MSKLPLYSSALVADTPHAKTMHPRIRPMVSTGIIVGPAMTVNVAIGDNLSIHEAIYDAAPGQILVINGHQFEDCAYIGSMLVLSAKAMGFLAIIIDGYARDLQELQEEIGFPVYALGTNPKGPVRQTRGEINVPIVCGDVTVNPGDIVFADEDGIVVIDAAYLDELSSHIVKKETYEIERRELLNKIIKQELPKNSIYPAWFKKKNNIL
ncbi:RraA family protein [Lysinibacillus endophyticus]|uniref:RraA family protein n=1 Tax=Ureibacillus endophyticus TaxID=1978490 RepID=UPI003134885E